MRTGTDRVRVASAGWLALLGFVGTCLLAAPAARAQPSPITVTHLSVIKSELEVNSQKSDPGGWYYLACVTATGDLNTANPGQVETPDGIFDALSSAAPLVTMTGRTSWRGKSKSPPKARQNGRHVVQPEERNASRTSPRPAWSGMLNDPPSGVSPVIAPGVPGARPLRR